MIPLRVTALVASSEPAVLRALGRSDVWTRTARAMGLRARVIDAAGPFAPLRVGDLIRIEPGPRTPGVTFRVSAPADRPADPRLVAPALELDGPGPVTARVRLYVVPTGAGVLVTADVQIERDPTGGPIGRRAVAAWQRATWPALRRRVLRAARTLLGIVALVADEVTVVVAGAVVHDGRVLAARRTRPAELAGRWELPGGKADPGESEADALARELREELGLSVQVGERVGPDIDLAPRTILRCRAATAGRVDALVPSEHDEIRWLGPDELGSIDWLDADRALLTPLRDLLRGSGND